jgi:hypothetical protein
MLLYNCHVLHKKATRWILLLALLSGLVQAAPRVQAARPLLQDSQVTAYDLIIAMNTLRTSNGLPALVEDPIIDVVAQGTAQTMAAMCPGASPRPVMAAA